MLQVWHVCEFLKDRERVFHQTNRVISETLAKKEKLLLHTQKLEWLTYGSGSEMPLRREVEPKPCDYSE